MGLDRSYLQCARCASRLFFVPLPGEVFTACAAWKENVKDIDVRQGISPAVKRHGMGGGLCKQFAPGKSVCEPMSDKPFLIPEIRREGEKYFMKILTPPKRNRSSERLPRNNRRFS